MHSTQYCLHVTVLHSGFHQTGSALSFLTNVLT